MHRNLRSFLSLLARERDLITIDAEVDPYLELAEVHRRVIARGGPALLFKRVKGSRYPVVTNLFGTARRIELAFGPKPEALVREVVRVAESLLPTWQEDGGPFFTLPLVYTEHPAAGKHNLGVYRMQRFDARTTGMHWQIHKGGGFHYHEAEAKGQALPVTMFLGGPPALILSAVAPLPEDVPELVLASVLAGEKIRVVESPLEGHPHRLVAEAEFALAGRVPPRVRRAEGPFGDHYGYYSLQHDYPVFHVREVFHRKEAIYPATVVGKPRQEDFF